MQNNRAKLFMPFDALNGLKEAIKETEYRHDNKSINIDNIENKLKRLNIGIKINVVYFYNFETINLIGELKKIDYKKRIIQVSNSIIYFESIDEIKTI